MSLALDYFRAVDALSRKHALPFFVHSLGLNDARDFTPMMHLPESDATICVAVGSEELPELRSQTSAYHDAWNARGLRGWQSVVKDRNHFTVMDELAAPRKLPRGGCPSRME
jgi:hypothetical protein